MTKRFFKQLSIVLSFALILGLMPGNLAGAKAKKPTISVKKCSITVNQKKTIKVKKATKKAKWKVISGKNFVTLKSKKKASVVVVGVKAGKAKVRATVGKTKLTCVVTVVPAVVTPTKKPTATSTPTATNTPAPVSKYFTGAEGKNVSEIKALDQMYADLTAAGANIDKNLNNPQIYKWDKQGKLTELFWSGCNLSKESISFKDFPALKVLDVSCNNLEEIDVRANTELEDFRCYENRLTTLKLQNNTKLIELSCENNKIGSLDLSNNTKLVRLHAQFNKLYEVVIDKCLNLEELFLNHNELKKLDVSGLSKLKELNCNGKRKGDNDDYEGAISSLNLSGCTALVSLDCSENALSSLDLTGLTSLEELNCYRNNEEYDDGIDELDISDCTALKKIDITGNSIYDLILGTPEALVELRAAYNCLESVDLSDCKNLELVDLSENEFETLTIGNLTKLKSLKIVNSYSIRNLDLSGCTSLEELDCSATDLDPNAFNISGLRNLKSLKLNYSFNGTDFDEDSDEEDEDSDEEDENFDEEDEDTVDDEEDAVDDGDEEGEEGEEVITTFVFDVSEFTNLQVLELEGANISKLILPESGKLENLVLEGAEDLTEISNIDKQAALAVINVVDTGLTSLDLSKCNTLQQVVCESTLAEVITLPEDLDPEDIIKIYEFEEEEDF